MIHYFFFGNAGMCAEIPLQCEMFHFVILSGRGLW